MEDILISVIVPVYNVEKYLERCVRSIQNQTYSNLEIILVDDGSTDGSPAMCDRFAAEDSRVKVIHKENGGVSSARNAGINVAGGYIAFVDSDDYVELSLYSEAIEQIYNFFPDVLDFGIAFLDKRGAMRQKEEHSHPKNKLLNYDYIQTRIIPQLIHIEARTDKYIGAWTTNKIFKSNIIQRKGMRFDTDIRIWEDGIFTIEFLNYAHTMVSLEGTYYNYRDTDNSLSTKHDTDIFVSIDKIYGKYRALYESDYDFDSAYSRKYQFDLVNGTIFRELAGEKVLGLGTEIGKQDNSPRPGDSDDTEMSVRIQAWKSIFYDYPVDVEAAYV